LTEDLSTILLVEDDPDIREVAQMALEAVGGFEVIACENGRDALRVAAARRPDLVLLDWMMPDLDGGQTLAALRRQEATRDLPVVFMTAKARPEENRRMRELGALDVIIKPFDPMTLSAKLREVWARRE
jgi:two-component system, OmpR family, response regulator